MQGEVRIAGWGEGRNQCEHGNTGGCVSEGKCKGDCRGESEGGGEGGGEGEGVVGVAATARGVCGEGAEEL